MSPRRVSVVGWVGGGLVGLVVGLVLGAIALRGADPTWLESVGTLAAALVAAAAAVSALLIAGRDRENANRQARKDRQHAALLSVITDTAERYRDVQQMLVAFDRYARFAVDRSVDRGAGQRQTSSRAADFTGRLRASTEELPRTRQLMFSHFKPDEEQMGEWLSGYMSAISARSATPKRSRPE